MLRPFLVAMVVTAGPALALRPGDTLYVVEPGLRLLKDPKASSAPAGPQPLPLGAQVRWLGAAEKERDFHLVELEGRRGYVPRWALSPARPQAEVSQAGVIDARAFASSGAEVKCRMPWPSNGRAWMQPAEQRAAAELIYAEALSVQQASRETLRAKVRALNPDHRKAR